MVNVLRRIIRKGFMDIIVNTFYRKFYTSLDRNLKAKNLSELVEYTTLGENSFDCWR